MTWIKSTNYELEDRQFDYTARMEDDCIFHVGYGKNGVVKRKINIQAPQFG
jgi:hypothetical protein